MRKSGRENSNGRGEMVKKGEVSSFSNKGEDQNSGWKPQRSQTDCDEIAQIWKQNKRLSTRQGHVCTVIT